MKTIILTPILYLYWLVYHIYETHRITKYRVKYSLRDTK